MKSILITLLVVSIATANIFDEDSDFMKGFEAGILMRNKKSQIEEFGCSLPENNKSEF